MVERVVVQGDPNPKPAEPAAAPEGQTTDRPEGLPEKFKDVASLASAYGELEKKLGESTAKPAEGTPEDEQKEATSGDAAAGDGTPQIPSKEQVDETLTSKGLDLSKLETEFRDKGALSEDTYADLESKGLDRATVDTYIEGRKSMVKAARESAFAITKGEEGFNAMANWARVNLSPEEVRQINAGLANPATSELTVRGLYSKYQEAGGKEPSGHIQGDSAGGAPVYQSRAQLTKDMSSPEYKNDPAFRAQVTRRMLASKRAGINLFAAPSN